MSRSDRPKPVPPGGDALRVPGTQDLVPGEDKEPVLLRLEEGDLVEVIVERVELDLDPEVIVDQEHR